MALLTGICSSSSRFPLDLLYLPIRLPYRIVFVATLWLSIMFVLPQSQPAGAAPFARIPTVDPTGRGIPLAALAGTPDHVLRAKFPAIAQALDHFAKVGGSRFSLKITWAGYEGMNFSQDMLGASLVKGVAHAFDRFLHEASAFAGRPPAPNLRPQHYALHDLVLTGIITFTGNVFQAEVQIAGQSRA